MKEIHLREIIISKFPDLESKYPNFILDLIIWFFSYLTKVRLVNDFISKNQDSKNIEFLDELFEYLDFSYYISNRDKQRIPSEGRLIIVANHPLGALDGLSLLKAVYEVRKDVKIVANDILMNITNLSDMFVPIDLYSKSAQKRNIELIQKSMQNEEALIFFPAGEVSRLKFYKIKDNDWQRGALKFAKKYNSPILPILVEARNSFLFYFLSILNKNISTLLLPREMFGQKGKNMIINVGNVIPATSFVNSKLNEKSEIKLLKKHTYNIKKIQGEIYKTEKNIIHPVSKKELKYDLSKSELLGKTLDDKKIYLVSYPNAENVLKEISRLREITYRKVGEGTGYKYDLDIYDKYYKHIVLWDEEELEIVGSYRLGVCKELLDISGQNMIYNTMQFDFSEKMLNYCESGIELGRSFVQQKYWGTNALDYLWQGIGAYLSKYNDIRYLFGAVSISANYNEDAKYLIIAYYKKWFSAQEQVVKSKFPYEIPENKVDWINSILVADNHQKDLVYLKNALKQYGLSVPVLLRKYTDICHHGYVQYIDYGIDKDFSNSIDCFILVDLFGLKDEFKNRYFKCKSLVVA